MAAERTTAGKRAWRLAFAASIPLLLASAGAIYIFGHSGIPSVEAVLLTTKVGEIRQVPLSDGSTVILDTGTRLRVEIGKNRRQAVLEKGRARFAIAAREAPFTVLTATTSVQAAGGVIDVSNYGDGPDIELIAGKAKIERHGQGETEALVVEAPSSISGFGGAMHALPRGQRSNWPTGRLSFANARLSDVIAASNRYTSTRIIIASEPVGELRVTGVFKAGDAEDLSKSLSAAFDLNVARNESGDIVLTTDARGRDAAHG